MAEILDDQEYQKYLAAKKDINGLLTKLDIDHFIDDLDLSDFKGK